VFSFPECFVIAERLFSISIPNAKPVVLSADQLLWDSAPPCLWCLKKFAAISSLP